MTLSVHFTARDNQVTISAILLDIMLESYAFSGDLMAIIK